jgi:hypothetical protein
MIALCICTQGQTPPANVPANDIKGMAPREAPSNYQAQGRAGKVTIGAEFMRHAVPTAGGEMSTEDYVVVEAGFFGAAGERMKLDITDFSLRINGKKPSVSKPCLTVLPSVIDPSWEPPEPVTKPSTGGISTGGGGGGDTTPPPPPKMPLPLRHVMEQKIIKVALPEGDRALPVAGLLFFQYHGKSTGIQKVELIYDGSAGKATLTLEP